MAIKYNANGRIINYIPQWNRSREQVTSFVTLLAKPLIAFTSKMAAAFIIVHLWDWVSGSHANPLRSINFTRSPWKLSKHKLHMNAAFIFAEKYMRYHRSNMNVIHRIKHVLWQKTNVPNGDIKMCWYLPHQGWRLLCQFLPFRYFPIF